MDYIKPEIMHIFPIRYQSYSKNYFYGTGLYSNALDITVLGIITTYADAYGTIILPTGDTLNNVIRVHYNKEFIEEIEPHLQTKKKAIIFSKDNIDKRLTSDTSVVKLGIHRWFADGYRYPVFESIQSITYHDGKPRNHLNTAFYYAPVEQYYGLRNDSENTEKRERIRLKEEDRKSINNRKNSKQENPLNEKIDIKIDFHKESNNLTVNIDLKERSSIEFILFDTQGRQRTSIIKPEIGEGNYSEIIPLYKFQDKEYILRIIINNKIYAEKLIK